MSGKRSHRRPAEKTSWALAFYSSQPYTQQKADEIMEQLRVALQLMLDGGAEQIHFIRLGVAINLAAVRCEQIDGNEQALEVLLGAGEALKAAEGIHERHGRYGLTGPGRHRLMAGIDAYEVILRASSPRQMHLAELELGRRLGRMESAAA